MRGYACALLALGPSLAHAFVASPPPSCVTYAPRRPPTTPLPSRHRRASPAGASQRATRLWSQTQSRPTNSSLVTDGTLFTAQHDPSSADVDSTSMDHASQLERAATAGNVLMNVLKEQPVEDFVGQWLRGIDPRLMRIWTKADFLHAHAVSGVVFMFGGTVWQLLRVAEAFQLGADGASGAAALAADSSLAYFFMLTGLVNALTAIPMARFSSDKLFDLSDLKGNGFSLGGSGLTSMCLWLAWWFSGRYPDRLHTLDGPLVVAFSLLCVATTVNWEVMLRQNFSAGDNEHLPTLPPPLTLPSTAAATVAVADVVDVADVAASASASRDRPAMPKSRTQRKLNAATTTTKIWLYRIASWPNLTQILFMSSIALGSAEWLGHVADRYPGQPRMLFDYAFASALGYSLSMFAETLRDRKLIGLQADFIALLVGVVAPMLVVAADCAAAGTAAEINPLAYWALFGQV